jgi:hypothetical protein
MSIVLGPVICQSVAVFPSSFASAGSVLVTLVIEQVAVPQVSAAALVTVTGTIL